MSKPNEKLEAIFEAALALETEDQRAAFLNRACLDPELRREVESLLAAHQNPDSVFTEKTVRVEAAPTEKPGDRIGRYKLLQRIGEGGCGVVYMAEQEEPVRRRVALKVIKLGMDTRQVIARFEAERQALALMDHPNIAKVLDAGATETGRPFFVMELVRGVKITEFCDQKNLSTRERLDLFIQVCRAVQHAHQKGIIHRDLKPSNILVTSDDGVPVPKVIDFGIAKATQGRLTDHTVFTAFEQFIGTPTYMSPEQAELSLHEVDTRTDIYSLGVLLYELLTGQTPFDAKELLAAGLDAMRRTIREVEPVKPSTRLTQDLVAADVRRLNSDAEFREPKSEEKVRASSRRLLQEVRGDLDWIAMKCLEKDRTRRYETANGLAADLQRHLNNEPVAARSPSAAYRVGKLVRRNKLAFAAAAAVVTMLVLGAAVSTWQAVRATRAERAQNRARTVAQTEANRAEAAANDSKRTLSAADFRQAARLIAEDNANDALPYLARSLSFNPANDAALTRLATLLAYRTWMLPTLSLKHEKPVNSAEYSPDGKRIVTASADGTARIWDAQTGQSLVEPMKHPFSVTAAQFSPDGKRIVTVSDDMTTRVWDAQTGQPVTAPMKHGSLVMSVRFSPDGKRLVTGSGDNTARVWNSETGQPLTEPLVHDKDWKQEQQEQEEKAKAKGGPVFSRNLVSSRLSVDGKTIVSISITKPVTAQFTPDGERIVTTSADGLTRVWNAKTSAPVTDPAIQSPSPRSNQLSPDGKRKVSISPSGTVRVLDVPTGRPLTAPMQPGGEVSAAQFSPDGERVVTVCKDQTVDIWEAQTAPPLPLRPPFGLQHGGASRGQRSRPQFSRDGRRIVMASTDQTARVWDALTGQPLARMDHTSGVVSARFSPDDQRIVTTADDRTARVWDAQTGRALTDPMQHDGDLYSAEFAPDGKRIATSSAENVLRGGVDVFAPRFSPDGKRLVVAWGVNRIWDARKGLPLTEPIKGVGRRPPSDPNVSWVISGVLDAQTGQLLLQMLHRGGVCSAQFSPDGRRIVTGSFDRVTGEGVAQVWDAQTGEPRTAPMKHNTTVSSVWFSPDGKSILTAAGTAARIWDAETGQPRTEPIRPSCRGCDVYSAHFSRDGRRFVTASHGAIGIGAVRVWDAETGQPLADPLTDPQMQSGANEVASAEFSPDGSRIMAAANYQASLWDVAPAQPGLPDWLIPLAEAISGKVLNKEGVLEPTRLNRVETLNQLRQKLAGQPDDDWVIWGRWLLADRATRTISPFAKVTVPDYIERLIKEKTRQSLDEAEPLAAGKPEIMRRISEARATLDQPRK